MDPTDARSASRRIPAFYRLLLGLLPCYLLGLASGPTLVAATGWLWPLTGLAALISGFLIVRAKRTGSLSNLVLLGAVFTLIGAAASASVFGPPHAPDHVVRLLNQPDLVFGGRVVESPHVADGRTRLIVETAEVLRYGGRPRPASGRILVTLPTDRIRAAASDYVRFPAELGDISNFENPGGFDYRRYMAGRGVWASAFVKHPRLLAVVALPDRTAPWRTGVDRFRRNAADFLDRAVRQPANGLMKALLLGVQDDVAPDVKNALRSLGLSHLLAVSGLHVGLIAWVSYELIRRLLLLRIDLALRWNIRKTAALLALAPVWFYAVLAGGRPSTTRAAIMVVVFLLAALIERRKDHLTALALAAWLILAVEPGAVFTASFQLSFAAVGAIIVLAPKFLGSPYAPAGPPVGEPPSPPPRTGWRRIWGPAVISAAALIGTAPIAVYHFNRLPLLSLPANLIFTPLISLGVIPAGLVALAVSPVFPGFAALVFQILERYLWLVLAPLQTFAAFPGHELLLAPPGPIFFVAYYLSVGAVFLLRPWKKSVPAAVLLAGFYAVASVWPSLWSPDRERLQVTFLDVGQGNAASLTMPDGTRMLVDGGGFPASRFDPGEQIIAPFLLDQGIRQLDIVALTHAQADHVGGLPFLVRAFSPSEFWSNGAPGWSAEYRNLMDLVVERGLRCPSLPDLHEVRRFGSARMRVLAPVPGFERGLSQSAMRDRQNDHSLVIKIEMGGRAMLFPGDIETGGEAELLRGARDRLQADVLLAPHHGGRESLSEAFLSAVRPQVVVFSVGRRNRFGFPAPEAVARVRAAGADIYRTDRDGAVTVVTDGCDLSVTTYCGQRD